MDEFKALCSKGDKAFKRNQLLQAITCYSDALTLSSDDTEVLGCRSVVYAKLGMFNESKKDAERLISIIPETPKGHYLRGVALENLGNYTECLKSYLKAYEMDVRCPTELLLSVVQVVGCVCQLSESEELTLSEPASTCQKFETLVQVGKRLYKTGNYKVCITVITTALKAHYRWNDKMFYSELTVENMRGRSFVKQAQKDTVGFSEDNLSSLPSPNFGFSSIYLATANQGCENDRNGVKDNEMTLESCRSIMSGLLVMGEAHYCLHQYKEALAVSKQCLSIALDLKDKEYEIKSYVKLANISIRLGQYVYAVSCNAKLLAVGRDLQTSSKEGVATYTDFWNSDVECRAVWNLSAAYKLMGNYKKALDYAQEYMDVLKCIDQENLTEAFSNLGELELLLGNHEKSLEYHKIELQLCKKFNDSHRMAYAYGNIGVALANTGSFNLAAVNHEQHLKLAQTLNDKISELVAIRNFGCLFRLKGEHLNALGYFEQHLQLAKVSKLEDVQCKAYHLIGACYCDLNQLHHAQYYYELCLKLAEEQSDLEQELETRFALAHITKSMRQFETSRQHFNKVIPALEQKLLSTHGRSLLHQDPLLLKLEKSYTELQEALAEMNLVEEALEIAEHCRSRILMNILRQQNVLDDAGSPSVSRKQSSLLPLSAKDIIHIVTSQQALVLFYSVIPSGFLTWLISPSKGIVKFHWDKSCNCITFEDKVELCVEEVHSCCGNSYKCDHRALPEKATKEPRAPYEQKAKKSCTSCEFVYSCKLTALQKLYHLLVIPVEDELHMATASGISQLIVVPDLSFNSVPFPSLQDQSGQYLYELFHVRILPCIRTISLEKRAVSLSKTSEEQVVDCSKILVIGNPTIPDVHLNGQIWSPINQSDLAEEELNTVASLLGVDAVTGTQATKDRFLKSLPETSVVHLVTYGSWTNACLALSPSPHCHDNPPSEESFLVTMSDISYCKLSTKLVVLNAGCGCGHQYCYLKHISFNLATALVAAGVQSVVVPLWSVPQALLLNLFYQFYSSLEAGKTVSESLKEAWTQVKNTEHMSFPDSWASYVHFGFDTTVDLTRLRHDLFDGVLDRVVDSCSPQRFPLVTAKMLDNKVPPVTVKVKIFQDLLTHLLLQHRSFTHVLPALTNVVQLANQMLLSYHHPELLLTKDLMMCAQLSSHALEAPFARDLLTFLGFDFQKDGARDKDPFVVFPHWDPDGALSMASQVLEASCDIFEVSSTGGYALAKITKTLKKNTMEKLKEFLSLSCRYPERILKTNDFVLHSLWFNPELQRFLASLGFYEVGHSLLFNKTEDNQSLLRCSLRIVSALLDYVEKGRIRTPSSIREISSSDVRSVKLASLSPQLTPSKQIVMGAPWMSTQAGNSENILKIALSKELEGINKEFAGYVTKSNYWHAELLRAQSCPGTSLPLIGSKEKTKLSGNSNSVQKAGKVKVHGGLTPSCNRRPVEEEPRLSINATRERRNEIYRTYAQRFDDIAMHKRQEVRRLFMSQIGDHA